ncbi:uncharacterized protein STEHIDRAFT_90583 [Stereum hirsutum FP-91666 SS1]|uniref:uncharacterized protein n=1 Tax=Stereum hirsutum (strain FP-91666) TaxID=721885 RepID=UPI000440CEB8|nr:uncharacterized protein STEHIDRAFT_90583 [Stereum hirsutum FP-91666 SS1]EIM90735.1 hypothetical protein STEHIDRAFT_90583 [Stereum hirsutum FP-91666 SS1]
MDDVSTGSDSDYSKCWISWFLSSKGNEYFCEVEEDYILDRFNLTGLNTEVQNYSQALDLITDNLDEDFQDDLRSGLDIQARLLYGLIHARWILTARGLQKMLDKFKRADFGRCPRVLCHSQPLLPLGLTDTPYESSVKLYCGRCEDIYSPKSSRHGSIDGAYFGTSFPHLLFLVYPGLIPGKGGPGVGGGVGGVPGGGVSGASGSAAGNTRAGSTASGAGSSAAAAYGGEGMGMGVDSAARRRVREEIQEGSGDGIGSTAGDAVSTAAAALRADRYRPRIFGFQVNEIAKLQRWQEAVRDRQVSRLEEYENT